MSALLPPIVAAEAHDQYLVSHGKSGVVGVFTSPQPLLLKRGNHAIVHTSRGIEVGRILGPATLLQARLLGATSAGTLLRAATFDDEQRHDEQVACAQAIFDLARTSATHAGLTLEILDVDLLFDRQQAIVQFVGPETDTEKWARALEQHFGLAIRLENLAAPLPPEDAKPGGCDKPDCGRNADGGACTSCGSGGGCSSCGSSKIDMREYFGHLREKMESSKRTPLATLS